MHAVPVFDTLFTLDTHLFPCHSVGSKMSVVAGQEIDICLESKTLFGAVIVIISVSCYASQVNTGLCA